MTYLAVIPAVLSALCLMIAEAVCHALLVLSLLCFWVMATWCILKQSFTFPTTVLLLKKITTNNCRATFLWVTFYYLSRWLFPKIWRCQTAAKFTISAVYAQYESKRWLLFSTISVPLSHLQLNGPGPTGEQYLKVNIVHNLILFLFYREDRSGRLLKIKQHTDTKVHGNHLLIIENMF